MRILLVILLLSGCTALKEAEDKVYDYVGDRIADACMKSEDLEITRTFVRRQAIEIGREIRQRPDNGGPPPPTTIIDGLDEKTANGKGPVVIIKVKCQYDTVTEEEWKWLVRDWRD